MCYALAIVDKLISQFVDCENREIVEWLSLIDFRETQRVILHGRALGTGLEPMQSEKYRRWRDGDTKMLWMPGLRNYCVSCFIS